MCCGGMRGCPDLIATLRPPDEEPRWRRGDWMQTFTGKAFYPSKPDVADIDHLDIAHALSLTCRYSGHVKRFYSVAEHCWILSNVVSPRHALWALLHDAAEAYLSDVIRPVKLLVPDYRELEDKIMQAICLKFGMVTGMPQEVRDADMRILLDERAVLLSTPPHPWGVDGYEPLGVEINCWEPVVAERLFLTRLFDLWGTY